MRTKSSEKAASDDHGIPLARDAVREGEWGPWCASCPSCVPGSGGTRAHGGGGPGVSASSEPSVEGGIKACTSFLFCAYGNPKSYVPRRLDWGHFWISWSSWLPPLPFHHSLPLEDNLISFPVGPQPCVCISYRPTKPRASRVRGQVSYSQSMWC